MKLYYVERRIKPEMGKERKTVKINKFTEI